MLCWCSSGRLGVPRFASSADTFQRVLHAHLISAIAVATVNHHHSFGAFKLSLSRLHCLHGMMADTWHYLLCMLCCLYLHGMMLA
jgi:hypothetical protein